MLKTRVITAVILTIGFLAALFLASKMVWTYLTLAATMIGVWEWSKLIKLHKQEMHIYVGLALTIGLVLIFTIDTPFALYRDEIAVNLLRLSAIFWIVFSPIWLINTSSIEIDALHCGHFIF